MLLNEKFEAKKLLLTNEDLHAFEHSHCCEELLGFIADLNLSVKGKKCSEFVGSHAIVRSLLEMIHECKEAIKLFPRDDTNARDLASRFGHPQYRAYYDYLEEKSLGWMRSLLPPRQSLFARELKCYFMSCFGDRQRIDYGTAHELHFILFLFCLYQLQLFSKSEFSDLVLGVFSEYLNWMRCLQRTYWLEPAGSHGVWGLDDYQFLPFFFGSSQLIEHKYIRPKSIHSEDVLREYASEYMYLESVLMVSQVKSSASLSWHSPMLNDISGVKLWSKINSGMMKMFRAEVLSKLPIMQHVLFGRLFGCVGWTDASEEERLEFMKLLRGRTMLPISVGFEEFQPPSGGQKQAHIHQNSCPLSRDIQDELVEQVVKYVKSPKGEWTPIYGRVPKGTPEAQIPAKDDETSNQPFIVDTFAMGQAHPTCCGIRIPSAHAAKTLPFD